MNEQHLKVIDGIITSLTELNALNKKILELIDALDQRIKKLEVDVKYIKITIA